MFLESVITAPYYVKALSVVHDAEIKPAMKKAASFIENHPYGVAETVMGAGALAAGIGLLGAFHQMAEMNGGNLLDGARGFYSLMKHWDQSSAEGMSNFGLASRLENWPPTLAIATAVLDVVRRISNAHTNTGR